MNRFAELLDRLAYEPGRNNKLRLITAYFRETEDPDRGYALAALTGALSFKHAKPGLIRDLITDRTDPVLFGLSYDYVGDLSETVALMWPKAVHRDEVFAGPPLSPALPRKGGGSRSGVRRKQIERSQQPRPPLSPFPPPLRGRVREGGTARVVPMMSNEATTTRLPQHSPKSSSRCARLARPNCRRSWRAGWTNSTRPAAGRS